MYLNTNYQIFVAFFVGAGEPGTACVDLGSFSNLASSMDESRI